MRPFNGYFIFALFFMALRLSLQGNNLYASNSDEEWTPSEKAEVSSQVKEVIEGNWFPQKSDETDSKREMAKAKMISEIRDTSAVDGNRFSLRFGSFSNSGDTGDERYLKFLIETPLEEKMRVGSFVSLDNQVYSLGVVVKFLGNKTALFRPYWCIDTHYKYFRRELVGEIGLGIERVLSSRSFLTVEFEVGYQKLLKAFGQKEQNKQKEQTTVRETSYQGLKIEGGIALHW